MRVPRYIATTLGRFKILGMSLTKGTVWNVVPPEANTANSKASLGLVRSRQRVVEHGEVFTPAWMAEAMLDLVKVESERIDSRVLEPACGSGNFLVPALRRKLSTVRMRYGSSEFELRHHALLALMCVYGIELLGDNTEECRTNLLDEFSLFLGVTRTDVWARAAEKVLTANVLQADALTMTGLGGQPIVFPEWAYLGKGQYQRRDFRYDSLTKRASYQGTLWDYLEEHEIFAPTREYPPMSVEEIAA